MKPYLLKAISPYSEQVGTNRQQEGNNGDMAAR